MINKICEIREIVKKQKPLIHCITNPISINQCANTILAVGAKPIMAEHPREVMEITESADGLMLNLGNITDTRMEAMLISANKANEKRIPTVLDVVGIACSSLRREYTHNLLHKAKMTVIKGNYSEIYALFNEKYSSAGVDSDVSLSIENTEEAAVNLAIKYRTIVLATGKSDIITDGNRKVFIHNGCIQLSSVTGTGCMLGALCTSFLASSNTMDAVILASAYLSICGQLAKTDKGSGSFMVNLLDKLSNISDDEVSKFLDMEEVIE